MFRRRQLVIGLILMVFAMLWAPQQAEARGGYYSSNYNRVGFFDVILPWRWFRRNSCPDCGQCPNCGQYHGYQQQQPQYDPGYDGQQPGNPHGVPTEPQPPQHPEAPPTPIGPRLGRVDPRKVFNFANHKTSVADLNSISEVGECIDTAQPTAPKSAFISLFKPNELPNQSVPKATAINLSLLTSENPQTFNTSNANNQKYREASKKYIRTLDLKQTSENELHFSYFMATLHKGGQYEHKDYFLKNTSDGGKVLKIVHTERKKDQGPETKGEMYCVFGLPKNSHPVPQPHRPNPVAQVGYIANPTDSVTPSSGDPLLPNPQGVRLTSEQAEMIRQVNALRKQNGVSQMLAPAQSLMDGACNHSNFMAHNNSWGHASYLPGNGYRSENISAGYSSPSSTVGQLSRSEEGHRENLLAPSMRFIGVCRAYNGNSDYKYYWTQNFSSSP